MNIPAEITAIAALETQIRALPEPRTPHLDVAAGGLQTSREHLQNHLDTLARSAAAATPPPAAVPA